MSEQPTDRRKFKSGMIESKQKELYGRAWDEAHAANLEYDKLATPKAKEALKKIEESEADEWSDDKMVDYMLETVRGNEQLDDAEKRSLRGSLSWLRQVAKGTKDGRPENFDKILDMLADQEEELAKTAGRFRTPEDKKAYEDSIAINMVLQEKLGEWRNGPENKNKSFAETLRDLKPEKSEVNEIMTARIMMIATAREYAVAKQLNRKLFRGDTDLESTRSAWEKAFRAYAEAVAEHGDKNIPDEYRIAGALTDAKLELARQEMELHTEGKFEKAKKWLMSKPGVRFSLGVMCLGGAAISAATGNVPLAGGFIAARAALSGVGTALSSEAGLDKAQEFFGKRFGNKLRSGISPEEVKELSDEQIYKRLGAQLAFSVSRGRYLNEKESQLVNSLYRQELDNLAATIAREKAEGSKGDAEIVSAHLVKSLSDSSREVENREDVERIYRIGRRAVAFGAGVASSLLVLNAGGGLSRPRGGAPVEAGPGRSPRVKIGEALGPLRQTPNSFTHTVIKDDNVWNIAKGYARERFGLKGDKLLYVTNEVKNALKERGWGSLIHPGDKIKMTRGMFEAAMQRY